MKKKMLAGILAAALVTVSLAGCGGKDSTDTASGAKAGTGSTDGGAGYAAAHGL